MIRRSLTERLCAAIAGVALASAALASTALAAAAQIPAPQKPPERAIRRDIPRTNMIRRAYAAGTRDTTGRPGPRYWQLWMDYTINARFDAPASTVTGREAIVLHNNSDSVMRSIVLRLDQNLFAPNVPRAEVVTEITDGMKVTRLAVDGQAVDLTPPPNVGGRGRGGPPAPPTTPYASDLNLTSARITLAKPIDAHGSATIDADWSFRVPRADNVRGIRMGRWGDTLYQVGQWYPRVAVYDDLREGGWDTDPYLGPSEFYNNLGHFDVHLDVPAGWLVGATGVLQNPQDVYTATERERLSHVLESDSTRRIAGPEDTGPGKLTAAGDRLVWHFVADTVGDVAWATSNKFVWDATRATIPGKGAIPINIMFLPGHYEGTNGRGGYATAGPIARHALQFYSKLWMPYTFPKLTIVDGPEGGMEYPMFIMSSAGASDHEIGHQWWPMMVNTNETWYGFMDEGFNQYMNILSAADRAGVPPDLDGYGQSYGRTSGNEQEAPLMWDANYGGPMYSFQAYSKAPLMLSMLGGIVGDTAVWHAMSDYAHAWRFKHPSPWDYAEFMDHDLHRDLGWFWYYWLFTTEDATDGSIQKVTTDGPHTYVTVQQDGQMPSPVVLKVEFAHDGPPIQNMGNSKMVGDTAVVTYPASVWFGGSKTFRADLTFGRRKINKITLDPHCRFPDDNTADNFWPRTAAPAPAATASQPGGGRRGPGCYE